MHIIYSRIGRETIIWYLLVVDLPPSPADVQQNSGTAAATLSLLAVIWEMYANIYETSEPHIKCKYLEYY